jgi:tritrans,polycis-undecaprenyl-diphosphate synthase [geranylgeranyl-diphosphate specific]
MVNLLAPIYRLYEWMLYRQIHNYSSEDTSIPYHIGVILDGNRRYGRLKGMDPWESHRAGAKKAREFIEWCWQLGIKMVTLYTLSVDNLQRPDRELNEIFQLAFELFKEIIDSDVTKEKGMRVRAIGKLSHLPLEIQEVIHQAEELTKTHDQYMLNVAIGYGGRQEIIEAVQRIAGGIAQGDLNPDSITQDTFKEYLYTVGLPDPDLIIRTSGEERISGFLIWQSAYAELYFCEVLWPEIRKIDLMRAIRTYQRRQRRFGK